MGSSLRPLGGFIADKIGGVFTLSLLLAMICLLYAATAFLPVLGVMSIIVVVLVAVLGMGNGAVFKLVPQRFQKEIGVATGLVGAFGGLGGFFLPILLGSVKQLSGSYSWGLGVLALLALGALIVLRILVMVRDGWRFSWSVPASRSLRTEGGD